MLALSPSPEACAIAGLGCDTVKNDEGACEIAPNISRSLIIPGSATTLRYTVESGEEKPKIAPNFRFFLPILGDTCVWGDTVKSDEERTKRMPPLI